MSRLSILHIEDDDGDATLLERAIKVGLSRHNPVLHRVSTIGQAEQFLSRCDVDLIIIDLNLPDVFSPDEGLVRMRQRSNAPFCVVSGTPEEEMDWGVLDSEIELHLSKSEFTDSAHINRVIMPLIQEIVADVSPSKD